MMLLRFTVEVFVDRRCWMLIRFMVEVSVNTTTGRGGVQQACRTLNATPCSIRHGPVTRLRPENKKGPMPAETTKGHPADTFGRMQSGRKFAEPADKCLVVCKICR